MNAGRHAARVGFEPTERFHSAAFKAAALVHYATSPGRLILAKCGPPPASTLGDMRPDPFPLPTLRPDPFPLPTLRPLGDFARAIEGARSLKGRRVPNERGPKVEVVPGSTGGLVKGRHPLRA